MPINQGFTLLELALVITLIAIITAIAIPQLTSLQSQANQARKEASLNNARSALAIYVAENGVTPTPTQLENKLSVEGGNVTVNNSGDLKVTVN